MLFVLQNGRDRLAKLEYSYGRRAQSVVYSTQWKDIATIETDTKEEAIAEANAAIAEWKMPGDWRLEGRKDITGTIIDLT